MGSKRDFTVVYQLRGGCSFQGETSGFSTMGLHSPCLLGYGVPITRVSYILEIPAGYELRADT